RTSAGGTRIGPVADVGRRLAELRGQLRVTGLEQPHERTVANGSDDRLNLGELVAAPEHVEKLRGLMRGATQGPRLLEENAPGPDRQQRERREDDYGKRSRARNEIDDTSVRTGSVERASRRAALHEQGEQRASKRAQTTLRGMAVRRWDSAMRN